MKFGNGSGIASPRGICTWPTLKFVANKRPHFKKHRSTLSLSGLWSKYKLSAPAQHGIWLGGCGLHIGLHVYKDSLSLNIVSLSGHHGVPIYNILLVLWEPHLILMLVTL